MVGFIQTLPKGTSIRYSRAAFICKNALSAPSILDNYFDLLEDTLEKNHLLQQPSVIFNVGETGIPLDPPSLMTAAHRGLRHLQLE